MRFWSSAIFVSLTSTGARTGVRGRPAFGVAGGFLPPVSHIIRTIPRAMLTSSQDWTFLGKRPGGFGPFSVIGSFMFSLSVGRGPARKYDLLLAHREIT